MFYHYVKTAIRYLLRNRGLTIINIMGLAIGICVFILIMHYVRNELSYDKFLTRQDNLTRIEFSYPNSSSTWNTIKPSTMFHRLPLPTAMFSGFLTLN
jgi:putative ABC transport system permease protein